MATRCTFDIQRALALDYPLTCLDMQPCLGWSSRLIPTASAWPARTRSRASGRSRTRRARCSRAWRSSTRRWTSFPLDELARLVGMGQVWVACPEDGVPVGMVIASLREGAVYIEELDVLPEHGRRGLGTRLLGRGCAWAR